MIYRNNFWELSASIYMLKKRLGKSLLCLNHKVVVHKGGINNVNDSSFSKKVISMDLWDQCKGSICLSK